MTLTHYVGGKLTGLTVDFPPSLNYPENTTFINSETFVEYILVAGVWEAIKEPAFLPTNIAGLKLWLDGADSSTITIQTGVSEWRDKSGEGNDVSQGTAANQPAVIVAGQNGLDFLRFDGVNDSLQRTSFTGGTLVQPNTIVCVAKMGTISNKAVFDGGSTGGREVLQSADGVAEYKLFAGNNLEGGTLNSGNKLLYYCEFNTTSFLRRSKIQILSGDAGTEGLIGITLGDIFNLTLPANVDICEMTVYDKALSTGEQVDIETYMTDKWGV